MTGTRKLGFIGVGNMGAPIAGHLIEAGHDVLVHDADPARQETLLARGAEPAGSPRDVADGCDIVFACLPTLDAYRAVALGKNGIAAGNGCRIYVNLGTTGSSFAKEIATGLAEKQIVTLDAPISGGPPGARAGTLAVMVSGARHAFEVAEPLLQTFGGSVVFVGETPGLAQTMKLVNNALSITALAITSEAFVMGAKAGLDPETMVAVCNAGSGRNTSTETKFPLAVLTRGFDYGATIDIIRKDMDLAVKEAEALGTPSWVANTVRQLLYHVAQQGAGGDDMTTLVRHFEDWGGVTMSKTR